MKTLTMAVATLTILAVASMASSQNIGLSFDELGTNPCIDGPTELVPNPDLGGLLSTEVYVGAWDLPELFGYDYWLGSSDAAIIAETPVFYPSTAVNSGINGDVRVGTGVCFHRGDPEAGPDPGHIRLAKHVFSWSAVPNEDVLFCIALSVASQSTAPQYLECVDNPVPMTFGVHSNLAYGAYVPDGCIIILFDPYTPPETCSEVVAIQDRSWGALKAAY